MDKNLRILTSLFKWYDLPISAITKDLMMNSDEESKRVKRIASLFYILVMAVIVGGTYLNQLKIQSTESETQGFQLAVETPIELASPNYQK